MDRISQDIDKINRAVDTMGRLLEELLELSRIGRVVGDFATCSLTRIAKQALQMAEARIYAIGGEVWIESAGPGTGTAVYFTLPDSEKQA